MTECAFSNFLTVSDIVTSDKLLLLNPERYSTPCGIVILVSELEPNAS